MEILKARTQLGDLGKDERTISETILRFESVNWIYLSSYQFLIKKKRFVESVSSICSVIGWFVINEPKGMWKEAIVKLILALPHYTKSFLNTVSRIFNKCLAEHWLDTPSEPRPAHC
jgi:hypothetical protein